MKACTLFCQTDVCTFHFATGVDTVANGFDVAEIESFSWPLNAWV